MKTPAALTVASLAGFMAVPVVLASGDATPTVCVPTGETSRVLATIRRLESGGDYQAQAPGSSASGAYQFTDATWNGYRGYRAAHLAPPDVQDAYATQRVDAIVAAHGDVAAVPVVWYLGHLPNPDSPAWNQVPAPGAGNRLTPRQYRQRWLDAYHHQPGTPGCAPNLTAPGWSVPGPVELLTPDAVWRPHHDYPAWDWALPVGTPVLAVTSGTVTATTTFAVNWYDANCPATSGCDPCGLGVTVTDDAGHRWTYCHASRLHVQPGDHVPAGATILESGNTGRSTGPHLHLALRVDGRPVCPQPLLAALADAQPPPDPRQLPTAGCTS